MMECLLYIIDRGHLFYVSMGLGVWQVTLGVFSAPRRIQWLGLGAGTGYLGLILLLCIHIMRNI